MDSTPGGNDRATVRVALRLGAGALDRILRGFALIPLIINRYGLEGYGAYSTAVALLNICRPMITSLGVVATGAIVRRPSDEAAIVRAATSTALAIGASLWVGLCLCSVFAFPGNARLPILVGWMGVVLCTDALALRGSSLWARRGDARIVIAQIAGTLVCFGGVVASCRLGRGLQAVAAVVALAGAAEALIVRQLARRLSRIGGAPRLEEPPASRSALLLRAALPVVALAIVDSACGNVDIVLVQRLTNPTDAGAYAAATRLLGITWLFPLAVSNALVPAFAAGGRAALDRCTRAVVRLGAAGLAVALCAIAAAHFAPGILSERFRPALALIPLLAWRMTFAFLHAPINSYLVARGRPTQALVASSIGAAVLVIGCAIVVPKLGVRGACIVAVVAEACKLVAFAACIGSALWRRLTSIVALSTTRRLAGH